MIRRLALLSFLAVTSAFGQEIQTAHTRYYDAQQIRPLGDYFGAQSSKQGFRTRVTTDANDPSGQYFILRLKGNFQDIADHAQIEVLRSDKKTTTSYRLDLTEVRKSRWLYLGLTGEDWPSETLQPVAWQILIRDKNEKIIATWKSFLWEKP